MIVYGDKDTLGHAMGKQFRASLAILDEGFAKGILKELKSRTLMNGSRRQRFPVDCLKEVDLYGR